MKHANTGRFIRSASIFSSLPLLVLALLMLPVLTGCGGSSGATPPPPPPPDFSPGATLPGYAHRIPCGSRADVQAKGKYDAGQWTVELCRMLDTGHPDDTLFVVDTPKVFSLAVTDNSGGSHNGDNVLNLVWTGSPNADTIVALDATAQGAPTIDGDPSDAAWAAAPTSSVVLSAMSGDNGITAATVQACHVGAYIYFRVTWSDTSKSILRKRWTWDGMSWSQSTENEDRLYFMFDIWDAQGTSVSGTSTGTTEPFANSGCTISCHGDGLMRLDHGRCDIWHWKAVRTDPAGYADDKWMNTINRKSDEGTTAYVDNKNAGGTGPQYRSTQGFNVDPEVLLLLPDEMGIATTKTSDAGFAAGDFLPGYIHRVPLDSRADVWTRGAYDSGTWTVEFSRRLDTGHTYEHGSPMRYDPGEQWTDGDTVPGYITFPPKGSFADVESKGVWNAGVWTVEVCRDMSTVNADDTLFLPGVPQPFSVAVTDNSGGTHNGNPLVNLVWTGPAGPTTLVAHDLSGGGIASPVVDGIANDAAWTGALISDVPLTQQAGTDNGIALLSMQAAYQATTGKIFFRFTWADATENSFRKQWTYNTGAWAQNADNEDRLFVMWEIAGALGTSTPGADDMIGATPFSTGGCTVSCHGDGLMRLDAGTVDTWHWKATRNNGSGWLDDKNMDNVGRHSDEGTGIHVDNLNEAGDAPNYQDFCDPGADVTHLNFVKRSGPEDAAFLVRRTIPFALGLTDNSGGSHDGNPLLNLKWSGTSIPTELVALDLVGAGGAPPVIDGSDFDGIWLAATPSFVPISPQSGGGMGIGQAEMRAVYDKDRMYLLVKWDDPSLTRDILKSRRLFDGLTWDNASARNEDRAFLMWGCFDEALGTATAGQLDGTSTPFRVGGCSITCHGDGQMRTDLGRLDVWHWKATRSNPLYVSDDKYFSPGGRKSDTGRSSYSDNGTGAAPAFQAVSGPGANMPFLMSMLPSGAHKALSLTPAANVAPDANAGVDQNADINALVNLDGSLSWDPNGDVISFAWTQVSGTSVTLAGASTATPSFTSPGADTDLVFQLIVSDGSLTDLDTMTVFVRAAPLVVSFLADVHPIFTARTCTGCHGASGGLDLSGAAATVHAALFTGGNSGSAVDLGTAANSLILTKPLDPGQGGTPHGGGAIFGTTADADYQTILAWILQGAANN